ncbi:MAG: penicillin-binding protein 1C [Verrucomicrobiae bacterium]|nr:penicillin-binding protein 1C [Verrucomicrobiae bacterium]
MNHTFRKLTCLFKRLLKPMGWATFTLLALWVVAPKPKLLKDVEFSSVIEARDGSLLRIGLTPGQQYRVYTPLEKISPQFVEATLLYEDQYYFSHPAVNPVAMSKAFWNFLKGSGHRRGASTITMQVARLKFGIDSKTWSGKICQILRAIQLERHYSKNEILEAYFNLSPYGGNIEGVGAAARVYFQKAPGDLTLPESLALAVIPQNPVRRMPRPNASNAAFHMARLQLFEKWKGLHPEDAGQIENLKLTPHFASARDLPFRAPHFAARWAKQESSNGSHPRESFRTTLDLGLQTLLEDRIREMTRTRKKDGIQNAAALLIDYTTMEVLASVGSADFHDPSILGQNDGTRMLRSPGSALKPFIYALAMDQGLIHPQSLLKDAPMSFNGYNPENFDRNFTGPIHAEEALIQSRNIPAVNLESQLRERTLITLLRETGVPRLKAESHYGLSAALGAAEVRMEDVAALYAMLANRGEWKKPVFLKNELTATRAAPGQKLISPEASFLVLDILSHAHRPGSVRSSGLRADVSPVAWKTGTSFSYRDAWTAGVFDRFVLVVWVGNFDAKPNAAFVGRSAAAPLFFSMIDAIRSQEKTPDRPPFRETKELNLEKVNLCAVSGSLACPHCQETKEGWFIPGVSPFQTCSVHRPLLMDPNTGLPPAPGSDLSTAKLEIFEFWSSDMLELFRMAGIRRKTSPESRAPLSPALAIPPEMSSPHENQIYLSRLEGNAPTVPLQASGNARVKTLFWFQGASLITRTKPGETFLWNPTPGKHTVSVVDDQGLSASKTITVSRVE